MKPGQVPAKNIDAYIAGFPADIRTTLGKIRALIHKTAPGGEERINYRMPAVFVDGRVLAYFAAFKDHIGIFPPARGDAAFMKSIAPYAGPTGNLSFSYDKPMPYELITKVIRARLAAVRDPATTKVKAKVAKKRPKKT